MPYAFSLSEKQIRHFLSWKKQFENRPESGMGGAFSFKFTPTTIGTIVQIMYENGTGLEKETTILDVTDYEIF